ncbi:putative lipase, partial [Francisella tularensis subsp. holarctica]|nr:putative lipase [Francisella tularensis subsp. holarctica]
MKKDNFIVLVHGFIKNDKDMRSLLSYLKKDYDDIVDVDLPTTFVSMEVAVSKLCQIIQNIPKTKSITF